MNKALLFLFLCGCVGENDCTSLKKCKEGKLLIDVWDLKTDASSSVLSSDSFWISVYVDAAVDGSSSRQSVNSSDCGSCMELFSIDSVFFSVDYLAGSGNLVPSGTNLIQQGQENWNNFRFNSGEVFYGDSMDISVVITYVDDTTVHLRNVKRVYFSR